METFPRPDLSTKWPELDMPIHEQSPIRGILTHTGMNMAGHDLMMYILWFWHFGPRWPNSGLRQGVPFRSQISVLNDLTQIMPMHEKCLLWSIDVHSLFLKFRSKMADQGELRGFPILNIWRPFHVQISALNDLSWTCLFMNNVCYGPLMYIGSLWNLGPRWPTSGKLQDSHS